MQFKRRTMYCFLCILLGMLLGGCATPYASIQNNHLKYRDFNISVKSISEHRPRFIEGSWNIENWLERKSDRSWHRKKIAPYKGDVYVDIYANGTPKQLKKYYTELVLDHDGSISTLMMDVTQTATSHKEKSIEDMLDTFVANMAASEPWYAGKRFESSVVNKNAKVELYNSKSQKIGEYESIVGYVNKTVFDSTARNANVKLAVFILKITDIVTLNRTSNFQGTKENIPVAITVVLESERNEFNGLVDDFYDFIGQIQVNDVALELEYLNPELIAKIDCTADENKKRDGCKKAVEENKSPQKKRKGNKESNEIF